MIRHDKETGKQYNKKTRYSGIPYPYIVVPDKSDLLTPYDLYRKVAMNKNGYWLDFAQYHIFRNEIIDGKPITEQLQFYLLGLEESTKNQIITELSNLGYNPFIDNIPFEDLTENISKFLIKRKEIIRQTYDIFTKNLIIEKNALILPLKKQLTDLEKEIIFKLGVGCLIIFENKKCEITINEIKKSFYEIKGKTIKTDNIYSILKQLNTNWIIDKEKVYLHNFKNTDSLEDIIEIIKLNIF